MTEEDARQVLKSSFGVSDARMMLLARFVDLVIAETKQQNLISAATVPHIWQRHILDSAQLLRFAPSSGQWLDLGSGAGFPGLAIAIIADLPMLLVESRRKRAEFLQHIIDEFALTHVTLHAGSVATLPSRLVDVITARAFASLETTLNIAYRFSKAQTIWILPRGESVRKELEAAQMNWNATFHVEQSITHSAAGIIVAQEVRQRDVS